MTRYIAPVTHEPTPEEITQKTAEIRARWTESERRIRRVTRIQSVTFEPTTVGAINHARGSRLID
jgi:hypothetical protein